MRGARLADADLSGARLDGADLSDADLSDVDLHGASMVGARLVGACMVRVHGVRVDLSEADLGEADLSAAQLPGVLLRGARLDGARADWARLEGLVASGASLRRLRARRACFDGGRLEHAVLDGADLSRSSLEQVAAEGVLARAARLERCRLQGAVLRGCVLDGSDLSRARLRGADLSGVSTEGVKGLDLGPGLLRRGFELGWAWLTGGAAQAWVTAVVERIRGDEVEDIELEAGVDFEAGEEAAPAAEPEEERQRGPLTVAHLVPGADLQGEDLRRLEVAGRDLSGADLRRARLDGLDLRGVSLRGARLDGAQLNRARLVGADLSQATAEGASFDDARFVDTPLLGLAAEGASFIGASFEDVQLRGARFVFANLAEADLRGADLDGVDLRSARLDRANLRGARLEGLIALPEDLAGAVGVSMDMLAALRAPEDAPGVESRLSERLAGAAAWIRRRGLERLLADLVGLGQAELGGGAPAVFVQAMALLSPFPAELLRRVQAEELVAGSDLRSVDLRGQDLSGLDLSGADLRGACLDGLRMESVLFTGAQLDGASMLRARLVDVDLSEASAEGLRLTDARLVRVDLRGLRGALELVSSELSDCELEGADLGGSDLRGARLDVRLDRRQLDGARLEGLVLPGGIPGGARAGLTRALTRTSAFVRDGGLSRPWTWLREGGARRLVEDQLEAVRDRYRRGDVEPGELVPGADLSGRDLRRLDLRGLDLSGADLSGARLDHSDLRGTRLSRAGLQGASLARVRLDGADLSEADLAEARLSGASLRAALLTGASLRGADLGGVDLIDTSLVDADLAEARFELAELSGADLEHAAVGDASFVGALGLSDAQLAGLSARGARVEGPADLRPAVAVQALGAWVERRREAQALAAELSRGADLSGRDLRDRPLAGRDLRGANLSGCELSGMDLRDIDLEGADLSEARLAKARLVGANLGSARLGGADLRAADLDASDLRGADLRGARLEGALLGAALLDGAWLGLGEGLSPELIEDLMARGALLASPAPAPEPGLEEPDPEARPALDLSGQDLRGQDLSGRDLRGADLRRARMERCKLRGADLRGADLSGARLDSVDLREALLQGARALDAVLVQADLRGAQLEGCSLVGADLSASDLRDTDLADADLGRALFDQAELDGAVFDRVQAGDADMVGALGLSGAQTDLLLRRGARISALRLPPALRRHVTPRNVGVAAALVLGLGGAWALLSVEPTSELPETSDQLQASELEATLRGYEDLLSETELPAERVRVRHQLARLLEDLGQREASLEQLELAITEAEPGTPDAQEARIVLARRLGVDGRSAEERAAYGEVLAAVGTPAPLYAQALAGLIESYRAQGELDRAETARSEWLGALVSNRSRALSVHIALARHRAAAGDYDDALALLADQDEGLDRDQRRRLDLTRAEILVDRGDLGGADVLYRDLVRQGSRDLDHARVLLAAAEVARGLEELDRAGQLLDEALRSPTHPRVEAQCLLLKAALLREQGQEGAAVALYQRVLSLHGDDPDALSAAQLGLSQTLSTSDQAALVAELMEQGQPARAAQILLSRARQLQVSGQADAAREVFDRVLDLDAPDEHRIALRSLAELSIDEGQVEEGIKQLRELQAGVEGSERIEVEAAIADALRDAGRLDDAEFAYASLVGGYPEGSEGHTRGLLGQAHVAEARGELEKARAGYRAVIDTTGSPALEGEALAALAGNYLETGETEAALSAWRSFLDELPPGHEAAFDARENIAWILRARGERGAALEQYEALLEVQTSASRRARAQVAMAELLEEDGRPAEAEALYRGLLDAAELPEDEWDTVLVGLVRCLLGQDRADEALQLVQARGAEVRDAATGPALRSLQAQALRALGRVEEAQRFEDQLAEEAPELGDDFSQALDAANALVNEWDFEGAIEAYEALLPQAEDRPSQAAILGAVAQARGLSGDHAGARRDYEACALRYADLPEAVFNSRMGLAWVDRQQGRPEDAIERYEGLTAPDPGSEIWLLEQLASAWLEAGDEERAAAVYKTLVREHAEDSLAVSTGQYGLAELERSRGELAAARGLYEQVARGSPDASQVAWSRLHAAMLLVDEGRLDDAEDRLDELIEESGDPEIALQARIGLSSVQLERGRPGRALDLVEDVDASELGGGWVATLAQQQATCLVAMGEHAEAEEVWARVLRDYREIDDVASQARLALGELALGREAPQDALRYFEQVQAETGDGYYRARALLGGGDALAALGRRGEAEAAWREVVTEHAEQSELVAIARAKL